METNNRWYVRRKDGKKDGSFSDSELIALIRKGIVEPEDEIWTMKMADWMVNWSWMSIQIQRFCCKLDQKSKKVNS